MANTFELIASSTVGSGGSTAAINFTSIPSTYTDLCLVASLRTTATLSDGWNDIRLTINGSNSSITGKQLYGTGSAAASNSPTLGGIFGTHASMTSNTFSNASLYIPNYAGNTNKSFSVDSVTEQNATSALADLYAGLWSSTSVINAIGLETISAFFVQYSTAYLYGVSNA